MSSNHSIVRELQAPLRRLYADEPDRALIVKKAVTASAPEGDALHVLVTPGEGYGVTIRAGIDRAIGGYHDAPNPAELLVASVAACADSGLRMVADILGVRLEHVSVEVTGEVDVRGALSVDRSVPVGFRSMTCRVRLKAAPDTNPQLLQRLLVEAERSCINAQTLRQGVPVEFVAAAT